MKTTFSPPLLNLQHSLSNSPSSQKIESSAIAITPASTNDTFIRQRSGTVKALGNDDDSFTDFKLTVVKKTTGNTNNKVEAVLQKLEELLKDLASRDLNLRVAKRLLETEHYIAFGSLLRFIPETNAYFYPTKAERGPLFELHSIDKHTEAGKRIIKFFKLLEK